MPHEVNRHPSDAQPKNTSEHTEREEPLTVEGLARLAWEKLGFVVGKHPNMRQNLEHVIAFERYLRCGTRPTVVITGPTGSGKGPMARLIHAVTRPDPIVEINCATVPEPLAESVLFGHMKGSFTDAHRDHLGAFERAGKGTVVLDEVTKLPLGNQAKLLHALEEGKFNRVGGETVLESHAMVIASGSEDLSRAVRQGTFLDELYRRLGVLKLRLPPLRDRLEDLADIARGLVKTQTKEVGADGTWVLADDALERLLSESWPGNIRQLRTVIRRSLIFAMSRAASPGTIAREHIEASLAMDDEEGTGDSPEDAKAAPVFQGEGIAIHALGPDGGNARLTVKLGDGSRTTDRVEAALVRALQLRGFSQARTAGALGRSRTHISKWFEK